MGHGGGTIRWGSGPGRRAARENLQAARPGQRLAFRRGRGVAKVAVARKLAVRLFCMLRNGAASHKITNNAIGIIALVPATKLLEFF